MQDSIDLLINGSAPAPAAKKDGDEMLGCEDCSQTCDNPDCLSTEHWCQNATTVGESGKDPNLFLVVGNGDVLKNGVKSLLRSRKEQLRSASGVAFSNEERLFDADWERTILPSVFCHPNENFYKILDEVTTRQRRILRLRKDIDGKFFCIINPARSDYLNHYHFDETLETLVCDNSFNVILTFPSKKDLSTFCCFHFKRLEQVSYSVIDLYSICSNNNGELEKHNSERLFSTSMWKFSNQVSKTDYDSSFVKEWQ